MDILTTQSSASTINERLKELRTSKQLLQRQAAAKVNLSTNAWSNYETGLRTPSSELLKEIAKQFNVSIEWLHGFSANIDGSSPYFAASENSDIAISRKELKKRKISEHYLKEIVVIDNAMNEAFSVGEKIIIKTNNNDIDKQPGIYAIKTDDNEIVLRGIRAEINGGYTLFTHNKTDFGDQTLNKEQLKNLNIVGKYIGHWHWADKKL